MAEVHELLAAFIAADAGPSPADPLAYLEQVDGADRDELLALIDAYLVRAPRRRVTADAMHGGVPSAARDLAEELQRSLFGRAGEWPVLLPRLRTRARLTRRALVEQLAAALGVEQETELVAAYYHEMERGLLASDGVSDRVLGALATLLDASSAALRTAGRAIAPMDAGPEAGVAYARTAEPEPGGLAPAPADEATRQRRTLVDDLFTGGASGGAT